jgi:hypothetical protein
MSKKLVFLEFDDEFSFMVEFLEDFFKYPGEGNEESHQLISSQAFKLTEPHSFEVSLRNGLADLEELFAVGD